MEPIAKTSHQQTRTSTKKKPTSKKLSTRRSYTLHCETMNVKHGIHHQKRITTKKKHLEKALLCSNPQVLNSTTKQQAQSTIGLSQHFRPTAMKSTIHRCRPWERISKKELPPKRSYYQTSTTTKQKHHRKRDTTKREQAPKENHHPKRITTEENHHQKNHQKKTISKKL
jgi:hypothetical protein